MLATAIDKQNWNIYISILYLFVMFPIHHTTLCNIRDYWQIFWNYVCNFFFYIISLYTWHHYLHFAETLAGSYLVPAVFCFLKISCSIFLIKHIFPVSWAPSLHWNVSQTGILYTPKQSFRTSNWIQGLLMDLG